MRLSAAVPCIVSLLLAAAAPAQAPAVTQDPTGPARPIGSVRAELFQSFRTNEARQGEVFSLRSLEPLEAAGCTLAQNTEIVGKVEALNRNPEGPRSLTLGVSFSPVKCAGASGKQVIPLLVAMQNHVEEDNPGHVPVSTAAFQALVSASMNTMTGPSVNNDVMLATRNAMEAGTRDSASAKPLLAGQVDGIKGLQLELPQTSPVTTLVFARDQTLQSLVTTLFLAFVPVPDALTIASTAKSAETEVCIAHGCSLLVPPTSQLGDGKALWSVSLVPLGFTPRPEQGTATIGNHISIHFLGAEQILLTFPLHTLMKRAPDAAFNGKSRAVRAVLLSRGDGHVIKSADWQVPDTANPYVWSFGRDTILAQVGAELILFGPNLEPEHRFTLSGPLASLTAAPSGDSVLLAMMHEKHTPKEHATLARTLGQDQPVPESYELAALDGHLKLTASRMLDNSPPQLALLDEGLVSAQFVRTDVWQISRTSSSGAHIALATVKSTCAVHVSSLRGNFILAEGCVPDQPESTWYRVLNGKGATLLKGTHDRHSYLLQADMDASASQFGLASVHLYQSAGANTPMRTRSSVDEAVEVYRSDNGELQFATRLSAGSAEQNNFALSPEGNALALFNAEQVENFELPSARK